MRRFKAECAHFSLYKRPIYTHDGASVKFKTNWQQMDNSVAALLQNVCRNPAGSSATSIKKLSPVCWKLILVGIYFMVKSSKHTPWLPDLFFSDVVLTKRHHRGPHSHFRGPTAISGGFQGHLRGPDRHPMGSISHINDPRESQGPDSLIPGGSKPCQGSESHLRGPKR